MAETIKGINVVIGAETTGLQAALSDVNKQSKNIQSELREVKKLLKLDPTNAELLAQKQKLLSDAVATTKEKLDRLRDAQSQVAEQFAKGEISEGQYRAFQREIVKTEEELKKLEKQLAEVNNKWKDTAKAIENFGEKTTALGNKLAPVSAAAGALGAGMVGLAVKTGQTADEINTLSKTTGLATDTIQKFKFASDLIDVSFETLSGSLTKLTRNMASARDGSKKTQEAFDTLGVKITDANGSLRDNEAVFNDVIDALARVKNETERDALAMQIFGKSAQELNPLILGGSDALKKLGEEAEKSGLILSQDALDAANAFNDEIDKLKATAEATFSQLGLAIGQILLPALKGIAEKAKELLAWFRSLDEGTLKFILGIAALVAGIAPALIIIGQMAAGVSALMGVVGSASIALSGMGIAVSGLAAPIAIGVASVAGLIAVIVDLWKNNEDFRNNIIALWTEITKTLKYLWSTFGNDIKAITQMVFGLVKGIIETFVVVVTSIIKAFLSLLQGDWKGAWDAMISALKAFSGEVINVIKQLIALILETFKGLISSMFEIGKNIVEGLWKGIKSMAEWIRQKVSAFVDDIVSAAKGFLGISSPSKVFADIGENISAGLAQGIESGAAETIKAISETIDRMTRAAKIPSISIQGDISGGNNGSRGDIIQQITIQSPTPLSPAETARQVKNASRMLALEW